MSKFQYKKTKDTKDLVEFEVTVNYELLDEHKDQVFDEMALQVQLPGFRPGKGPREAIEEKLGSKLVTNALSKMIPVVTYEIIVKEGLNPVTTPQYNITDIDKEKGVVYQFAFVNYPEVKLGDFSKINITKQKVSVTEKEIMDVLKSIVKSTLPEEKWKKNVKEQKKTSKAKDSKSKEIDDYDDFEVTEEMIKELGYEKEKTLDEVKESIKSKLEEMKKNQAEDEYANKLIEEAIKLTKVDVPSFFVESEVLNLESSFKERLKQLGMDYNEYLTTQGVTEESKRKEWNELAEKKVMTDIVLMKIASDHNVLPTDKDVQAELDLVSDIKVRESYKTESGMDYIRTILAKQNALKKLIEIVDGGKKSEVKSKTSKDSKK